MHLGVTNREVLWQDVKWLLVICAYVAFFISGCGAALLRCIPLLASVIMLHAALRRAATECRCRRGQVPGVPFRYPAQPAVRTSLQQAALRDFHLTQLEAWQGMTVVCVAGLCLGCRYAAGVEMTRTGCSESCAGRLCRPRAAWHVLFMMF